jgi:hypothetical protein
VSDAPRANDALEVAICAGVVHALRRRAAAQRGKAAAGIIPAGEHFPGILIRSPEGALALCLAAGLERIAEDLESRGAT